MDPVIRAFKWHTTNTATSGMLPVFNNLNQLECGPMPNVMTTLPNIGAALCSMRKVLVMPTTRGRAATLPRRKTH